MKSIEKSLLINFLNEVKGEIYCNMPENDNEVEKLVDDYLKKPKIHNGFVVGEFQVLEQPVDRGILEPLLYKGRVVVDGVLTEIMWDEKGRCANHNRGDCFLNLNSL